MRCDNVKEKLSFFTRSVMDHKTHDSDWITLLQSRIGSFIRSAKRKTGSISLKMCYFVVLSTDTSIVI